MKLAVYAIAKNEAKHVERWYESVKDADEIIVLDTGSTDGTQKLLSDLGVRVASMSFEPFRFDTARNAALNLVSLDADYCMFLDLDETMPKGSIAAIRKAIKKTQKDMYALRLVFQFDHKRQPIVSYPREAVHKRNDFYWKYPVHELLACHQGNYSYEELDVQVFHEPDETKERSSYLSLLETAVEENPNDPRQAQYLGREYMYQGRPFDAQMWLKRHIQMEPHGPFRSESASYIAQCFMMLEGQLEEALDEAEAWYFRAIAEFNSAREPFCELADLYFKCQEYESAIGMLKSAMRIPAKPNVAMISRDEFYSHWPHHMLAACYFNIGNRTAAKHHIQEAMKSAGTLSGHLANDIVKILGLENATQSLLGVEASSGIEGRVPEDGSEQTEAVSDTLSSEQPSLSSRQESQDSAAGSAAAPSPVSE